MVIVHGSPLEEHNLFGYKNGDIGLYIDCSIDGSTKNLLIWFAEDKKYWVPEPWIKKVGEEKC